MKSVLSLHDVNKTIKGKQIIKGLSFSVNEGEVFGFLGPNGAGKTTTIRMIVGLMGITEGDIIVCGKSVKKDFEEAVRNIGAIVENPEMYKFLTGYQNLLQYARMHKGITKDKITEVIELVGLTARIHDKVKTYSLGMRQRLGLAQCLLHDPKLLILDEPTNGLDPAGIREIRDHLRMLTREKGMSVIVSSHLLSEMEMMCDRIAIIQDGSLIDVQQVHDFVQPEQILYVFETGNLGDSTDWLEQEYAASTVESGFSVEVKKNEIPALMKKLVLADVEIFSVKPVSKSLEDRFLEITSVKGE
ncbi:ABC-2 type transport system ATP-binding protein [Bacillus mesophilus]|uniref:ABC transporter ATP-binding protein n=1 Tax=Bacillus mesophilus TaxID=1808955 RepID=A0A6M0Q3V3_9BACI|nr:ABC transporter ATP-binding protein [Bacillus mesophilus]MBM7660308.1 ABC-2 type transport system ATP-binding protein [Bacillus mesophilus]NEY71021.1 ABC transporter ATP-binding protein [Bacillus mesophilus]